MIVLHAKVLDPSGSPVPGAALTLSSFRPPHFSSDGSAVVSDFRTYHTNENLIHTETLTFSGDDAVLSVFPAAWLVLSSTDGLRTPYKEGTDYTVNLETGEITRLNGAIPSHGSVDAKYLVPTDGLVHVTMERGLVTQVKVPACGFDVIVDLRKVPNLVAKDFFVENDSVQMPSAPMTNLVAKASRYGHVFLEGRDYVADLQTGSFTVVHPVLSYLETIAPGPGTRQEGTITLSGTMGPEQTLYFPVNSLSMAYTTVGGETLESAAAAIAGIINADEASPVTAAPDGAVVTLVAKQEDTPFTVEVSVTRPSPYIKTDALVFLSYISLSGEVVETDLTLKDLLLYRHIQDGS